MEEGAYLPRMGLQGQADPGKADRGRGGESSPAWYPRALTAQGCQLWKRGYSYGRGGTPGPATGRPAIEEWGAASLAWEPWKRGHIWLSLVRPVLDEAVHIPWPSTPGKQQTKAY